LLDKELIDNNFDLCVKFMLTVNGIYSNEYPLGLKRKKLN